MYPKPSDVISERAVLAGIIRHGNSAFVDVADVLNDRCYVDDSHCVIHSIVSVILNENPQAKLDIPTILSKANELGLTQSYFDSESKIRYLRGLCNYDIDVSNVRPQAQKLRKLLIARDLRAKLDEANKNLENIGGTETFTHIVAVAEKPLFDTLNEVNSREHSQIVRLGDVADKFIENIEANPDKSVGIPTGYPEYDNTIGGGHRRGKVHVVVARQKMGKAQPLYSTIMTPNGPKKMGDIKLGDIICHPSGDTTKVIAIHPQGSKQIYRIHFKYGEYVDCCEDHLWKVWNRRKKNWSVLSVKEILDNGVIREKNTTKWFVPLCEPVSFNKQNLPIDPYILGVLLGDGGCTQSTLSITNTDQDIIKKVNELLPDYLSLKDNGDNLHYRIINKKRNNEKTIYKKIIDYLNLSVKSHFKYIPDIYKLSSVEQRLELIRGLMDTDGSVAVKPNGSITVEYTTTSLKLSEDFQWLIKSIGGYSVTKERYTSYTGSNKQFKSFRTRVIINDPSILFSCKRKKDLCRVRKNILKRPIVNIEKLGQEECQCITVEANDGLYITDNFVVTHNSHWAANVALNVNKQGYPTLLLDLELDEEDQLPRILANIGSVKIEEIEKGKFVKNHALKSKVKGAVKEFKKYPFYHIRVGGMPFEEILAIARRWITRYVGFEPDGKAKPCHIIYDYLSVNDSKELGNIQENQLLGIYMAQLEAFAQQYSVPILVLGQTNRDGISSETTAIVAGSDRIGMKCASLTVLKPKSEEEIAEDGIDLGNKKMVVLATRFGPGHTFGEYINIASNLSCGKFIECGSKSRPLKQKVEFEVDQETIEF